MTGTPFERPLRVGRIGFLNVLPIHYPLEHGIIRSDFELIADTPARLNACMDRNELDISGCSCIEYARRPGKYSILPDLAIASRGPVQSVLLLCRGNPNELDDEQVLLSAQSNTSVALVDILLGERLRVHPRYVTGDAMAVLERGERPPAILTIGDEALRLRRHPDYPCRVDLGEAWFAWTGLPFVFAVWITSASAMRKWPDKVRAGARKLVAAKKWGQRRLAAIAENAAPSSPLNERELLNYFTGLDYDLGSEEIAGMRLFYQKLASAGLIPQVPELRFLSDSAKPAQPSPPPCARAL